MITLFFNYQTDLPADAGYELFHAEHWIIMTLCVLFIIAGIILYDRLCDIGARTRLRRVLVCLAVFLIIARTVYVCICHANIIYELPLHLCSLAGFLCFIFEFGERRFPHAVTDIIGSGLVSVCLVGALLAIIFTDGTMYPAFHFITIESNLYHSIIVMYILIVVRSRMIVPSIRKAYKSVILLMIVVPPVYLFDRTYRANYMFLLRPSIGSPLEFSYANWGYAGYLICYAILVIIEIYVVNALLSAFERRRRSFQ